MPDNKNRTHRRLGGSTGHVWSNCPGSVFLYEEVGPQKATAKTDEGTKAHDIVEIVVSDFLDHKIHGTDPDIRSHLTCDDDDMLDAALGCRDAIWTRGLHQSITGKAFGFEEEFTVDENLDMGGPCDFWCIYIDDRGKRAGYILDYKYGMYVVHAKKNPQLAVYAVGMWQEMLRMGKDLDYVRAAIYQPRAVRANPYDETTFTKSQLVSWEKKFRKAAKEIYLAKEPKLKLGDWCTYCRAKGVCKAFDANLKEKTSLLLVDKKTLPKPEQLPDKQIAQILQHQDDIEDFLKSCYTYAFNRFKRGAPIPGFKVVSTQSKRKWKEETEEIATVLANEGIENPYNPPKLKPLTQIEKTLTKLKNSETAKQIIDKLTTQTLTSEVLVPDDDPRTAIGSNKALLETPINIET